MDNVLNKPMEIINSSTAREAGSTFLKDLIGALTKDPNAILSLLKDAKSLPSTIRDGIFFECLETYITNVYTFNAETYQFEMNNLDSLAVALAEASPNTDAEYRGDQERLNDYAKRIIKLIDDCGTRQKAYYLACITRALLSHQINTTQFFQLSRCIRNLTEEDLGFLNKNISTGIISSDDDYIDDYRALGLIRETNGGFAYTKRAFELKKYALSYEHQVEIPNSFPARAIPSTVEAIPNEKIRELFEDVDKIRENQEIGMF